MSKPTIHQLGNHREQLVNFVKMEVEAENWRHAITVLIQLLEIDAKLTMTD